MMKRFPTLLSSGRPTKQVYVARLRPSTSPGEPCGICGDDIGAEHPSSRQTCDHVLGHDCILEWFEQGDKMAQSHACPMCRTPLFLRNGEPGDEPSDFEYLEQILGRILCMFVIILFGGCATGFTREIVYGDLGVAVAFVYALLVFLCILVASETFDCMWDQR